MTDREELFLLKTILEEGYNPEYKNIVTDRLRSRIYTDEFTNEVMIQVNEAEAKTLSLYLMQAKKDIFSSYLLNPDKPKTANKEFAKMNPEERTALFKSDPALYNKKRAEYQREQAIK